ncbi:hypothetical protein K466DRAFT_582396, partial [Polyporus arcularius HHB13444]
MRSPRNPSVIHASDAPNSHARHARCSRLSYSRSTQDYRCGRYAAWLYSYRNHALLSTGSGAERKQEAQEAPRSCSRGVMTSTYMKVVTWAAESSVRRQPRPLKCVDGGRAACQLHVYQSRCRRHALFLAVLQRFSCIRHTERLHTRSWARGYSESPSVIIHHAAQAVFSPSRTLLTREAILRSRSPHTGGFLSVSA